MDRHYLVFYCTNVSNDINKKNLHATFKIIFVNSFQIPNTPTMKKCLAVLLLLGCSIAVFAQNVNISGVFKNRTYSTEIVVMYAYTQKMITSAPIQQVDSFAVNITLEKPEYLYIGPDEYNVVLIIASPGENIHITADVDNITHPVVSGSLLTTEMYHMMDKSDEFARKSDSIYKAADSISKAMESQRTAWYRQQFSSKPATLASLVFSRYA